MWEENLKKIIKSLEAKIRGGLFLDAQDYETLIVAGHAVIQISGDGQWGFEKLAQLIKEARDE